MFTVGALSKLTGVTVRTLHHYDRIGLVRPSRRSGAGYRLYDDRDVLRLQKVLALRESGMPLEQIGAVLSGADPRDLLVAQRASLSAERARLDRMIAALDRALARKEGAEMTEEEVAALFAGFDPSAYTEEAAQRWGDTDAFRESARRTRDYTVEDWERYRREAAGIDQRMAGYMREGRPACDPEVQDAVALHRMLITRWFYPCSVEMHRVLGALYVSDPRFTDQLDRVATGYAHYLAAAIAATPQPAAC